MESLCELFFEVSNEDRFRMLQHLRKQPSNISGLSRELDLTSQECSRHVSRLTEVGLTSKDPDGFYQLSVFGRLFLRQLQGQLFTSKHKDYFNTHSLEKLPDAFIARVGDLASGWLTPDVMVSIGEYESIIREAKNFLWVIIDQRTPSVRPLVARAVERGVEIRSLSLIKREFYGIAKMDVNEADERIIIQGYRDEQVRSGDLDDSGIFLYMSEKAVFIAFPLEGGSFDYTGFSTTDEKAISLCGELFDHYWEQAYVVPRIEMVERMSQYLKRHGLELE